MLSACASSGARPSLTDAPAPSPVIETREVVVRECPAALSSPIQPQPMPEADAVVEYNTAGARWLAAMIAWAAAGWAVVADAADDCPKAPAA